MPSAFKEQWKPQTHPNTAKNAYSLSACTDAWDRGVSARSRSHEEQNRSDAPLNINRISLARSPVSRRAVEDVCETFQSRTIHAEAQCKAPKFSTNARMSSCYKFCNIQGQPVLAETLTLSLRLTGVESYTVGCLATIRCQHQLSVKTFANEQVSTKQTGTGRTNENNPVTLLCTGRNEQRKLSVSHLTAQKMMNTQAARNEITKTRRNASQLAGFLFFYATVV